MRRYVNLVLAAFLAMAPLCSCDTAEPDSGKVGVKVSASSPEYKDGVLSFVLESENAEALFYGVAPEDGNVVADTEVEPLAEQTVEVVGLEAGRTYIIVASAVAGDEHAEDRMEFAIEDVYTGPEYKRRLLVSKFTAMWCAYCPQMTAILDRLAESRPDSFIVTAVHSEDDFETRSSDILLKEFFINSFPTAVVDYSQKAGLAEEQLELIFEERLAEQAVAGIGVTSSVEGEKMTVSVTAEAGKSVDFRICCLVMEDNLLKEGTLGSSTGYYDHVVRTFLTDPLGDEAGVIPAGERRTFEYSCDIPDWWNAGECSIAAYILCPDASGEYSVTNAVCAEVGEAAEIEILK